MDVDHEHLIRFFTSSLRPNVDGEVALTMLMAGLHQAHRNGVGDAAEVCELLSELSSDTAVKRVSATIGRQLRALQTLNDSEHEKTIHTW